MYKIYAEGILLCDSRIDELAVISPIVTLGANTAGSFQFTLPPEHPKYCLIKRRTSVISVYRDEEKEPVFQGICTEENIDFYKQKTIICEGELTYLNDSIQRPARYQGITVLELLKTYIANHNAQVDEYKRFEIGTVTVTDPNDYIYCYTNMKSTMTEIKEDLIDDLGGYLQVRYADGKKYIDYLAESPKTSTQVIELGKNLLDYTSNIDNTELATAIIPLGAADENTVVEGLEIKITIKTVNNGVDYVYSRNAVDTYGWIYKTVEWPDVTTPSILKQKGEQYLADTQFENVVIKASAVDFGYLTDKINKFQLLDSIHVISEPHGMDRWFTLTKQTLNLNNPENDTIVLGTETKLSLSARSNAVNAAVMKAIEQILPSSDVIKMAVEQATNLITGAEGGHVLINLDNNQEPYEILIMDTDSITTAKKIWRWNINGLGYSSNGYKGPYGTAITMDGRIVADYITTGTLSADRIKGGTITAIKITNGAATINEDGSASFGAGKTNLGSDGSMSLCNGAFSVTASGDIYVTDYNGTGIGYSGSIKLGELTCKFINGLLIEAHI